MKLIDISRMKQLLKSLFVSNSQEDKIMMRYMFLHGYKMVRLFIIAIFTTYISGCLWYFIISYNIESVESDRPTTFNEAFFGDEEHNLFY